MTILKVVQQVCSVVGVIRPQSVFANINASRTMQEMLDCANETAQSIAYDTRDWTMLQKTATFVGDGATSAFDLPPDYKRTLLSTNVWLSTSLQQPMTFVHDPDEWLQRRNVNIVMGSWGEWTIIGGKMHIWPIMAGLVPGTPEIPAVTAMFNYLDKNCINISQTPGGVGDEFMNDADSFRLDERLLKLGIIFNWKKNKGSPYAEDMSTYYDALANLQGRDQPAPILADTYIRRAQYANYYW